MPGVPLNAQGRDEATRLAERLASVPIAAIVTSPVQRARETADAIAARTNAPVHVDEAFTELDVGAWTGCTFQELGRSHADEWRRFNAFRSGTRAGGGELMLDAQVRAVSAVLALRGAYAGPRVVVVSHADVIKAVVAYFIGMSLDLAQRLEVATASVTTLALDGEGVRLLALNDTGRIAG
jgi:probable phosphoglycerate mutase